MNQLIDELIYFNRNYDYIKEELSDEFLEKYFNKIINENRLITYFDSELIGYIESWRINYEQFGRIMCNEKFNVFEEDLNNGNICYVANLAIRPEFRGNEVLNIMKKELFLKNYNCNYFCGFRQKRTTPIKIFRKNEVIQNGKF